MLTAAAGGLVAHQLVDHPGGDAGVLQPGREGVAEVVGAVEVYCLQDGMLGSWPEGPSLRVRIDGGDVGRRELGQGAVDGGPRGGPALGAELGGELFGGEGTVVAERPETRAAVGRSPAVAGLASLARAPW
jgi:hypothetical protein